MCSAKQLQGKFMAFYQSMSTFLPEKCLSTKRGPIKLQGHQILMNQDDRSLAKSYVTTREEGATTLEF